MRATTIPRLELTAAVVASKVSNLLNSELDTIPMINEYWSDSRIVLGYISNEVKRFRIYVANRAQLIRETTDINRWHYVSTNNNPADFASRGLEIDAPEVHIWFKGPTVLWNKEESWNATKEYFHVEDDDPEIRKVIHVNAVSLDKPIDEILFCRLENRVSSWFRCIRLLCAFRKFIALCKQKISNINVEDVSGVSKQSTVVDLQESENCLIRMIQKRYFKGELKLLKSIK